MTRTILILLIGFLSSIVAGCSDTNLTHDIPLVPRPAQIVPGSGNYLFSGKTVFAVENEEQAEVARSFIALFTRAAGFTPKLTVGDAEKGNVRFQTDATLKSEAYTLQVSPKEIIIEASDAKGFFYALQTIRQLFPASIEKEEVSDKKVKWSIPAVSIQDEPRFGYRALLLDASRFFIPKENVLRIIDCMAMLKINTLHFHLTDDNGWRVEIKKYPRLTEVGAWRVDRTDLPFPARRNPEPGEPTPVGGFYTQEDVKEVLAYAAERYVRVIPEIDVPGHSLAALVAYPDLACMKAPSAVGVGNKFYGEDENTLCVGKDATFEFMDKVLTEVAALFPDEYVHIGGDECFKGFWHKCPRCQARMKVENLKNENELQSYFIHRMESILKEKGKKLIGWDEIIDGGLAPDATVMSWRGMEGGIKSAKAGHHVIMTPTEHCYIDLWQGEPSVEPDTYSMCRLKDSYSFNPVPDSVPAEMILGGQGNLWAESVPTFRHAEYMTWPRGWALAEVLWTGPSKTDWDRFWPRVEQHFVRADQAQINYARSMYNAIVTPYYTEDGALEIKLDSEPGNLDIHYTFDNTDPDNFTPKYEAPLRIPKNATWLRIVTYRDNKPIGKVITLTIKELEKRAENTRHVVGNL